MASLELSPAVFAILSALIEEQTGLHYGLLDREVLAERASTRAEELGIESLLDYYYYIRYDANGPSELRALTEVLVVRETYFFREWVAIEALVSEIIEPWCKSGRKLRVWSCACANGEEPLSLAMLLHSKGLLDRVQIVASDISERGLSSAKSGLFGPRSVRQAPRPDLVERYLVRRPNGWSVDRALISKIDWRCVNLMHREGREALGTFDVILMRNVIIYFSDQTIRGLLDGLAQQLSDDGVLLVGVSESLLRLGTVFTAEERAGAFFYRKSPK